MKARHGLVAMTLVIGALVVAGCGDAKSPRDVQKARTQEQIKQRLQEIEPIAGEYEGSYFDENSQRSFVFRLNLIITGEMYDDAGVPEEIPAPTLSATAIVDTSQLYWGTNVPEDFDRAQFNSATGELTLYTMDKKSTIRALVSGTKVTGTWTNKRRGMVGNFEVVKTRNFERHGGAHE